MTIKTQPMKPGAPLNPDDYPHIEHPDRAAVAAELIRAKVELMHAIARHRKAWAKMAATREEAEKQAIWADSHPPYQLAVSDVRWWREEMTAQAAAVTALSAMDRPVDYSRAMAQHLARLRAEARQAST